MIAATKRTLGQAMEAVLAVAMIGGLAAADAPNAGLKVGDPAPAFEAVDDLGQPWKSADHVGKKYVVVYFFPGDFTPGCTSSCGQMTRGVRIIPGSRQKTIPGISHAPPPCSPRRGLGSDQGPLARPDRSCGAPAKDNRLFVDAARIAARRGHRGATCPNASASGTRPGGASTAGCARASGRSFSGSSRTATWSG